MDKLNASFALSEASRELGYSALKSEQLGVSVEFMLGRDVFAILPTGFGNSLCYAVLPWAFDKFLKNERGHSIVIVVTPLLAIIEDQVS